MPARLARRLAAFAVLALCPLAPAFAEPGATRPALTGNAVRTASETVARFRLDAHGRPAYLARFSDGPRNVPRARGAALARAARLGLADLELIKRLLWSPPSPELVAEIPGEDPKKLLWPVVGGHFGRGFGYTRRVRPELAHNGVDIGGKRGATVRAAADGLVVYSDNGLRGYGNCLIIVHRNGWMTLYAHNLRTTVQAGWRVKQGERIGLVGQTGYAWGPHLHFELRDRGKLRDPEPLFIGRRSAEINGPVALLEPDELLPADIAAQANGEALAAGAALEPPAAKPEPEPEAAAPMELVPHEALPRIDDLLRRAPTDRERALAGGRSFRTLLWPVKGGSLQAGFATRHQAISLAAEAGSGVRAAADGLVVYSGGELRAYRDRGHVVVLLHGNGWVTAYAGVHEAAVRPGQRVLRGQWLARAGEALRFEWLDQGRRRDPEPLLAGAPLATAGSEQLQP